MRGVRRGLTLVTIVIAVLGGWVGAVAQVATTTIQDTVYRADGTPASGTVVVSWGTFTTAAGQAVAAGNTSAAIGPNGALSLALTPNANATPTGIYYTAVLHLDDGTTSQQYWVIPVSAAPVTLASIENQVLPTSVAMQTASRAYVDAKVAQASTGSTGTTGSYVPLSGGTMTGPLLLPADPVTPNQAADKHYVDTNVTQLTGGMGQKVSLIPSATQTVAQPAGTQMQVNALNGTFYASQFQTGDGGNGIANALSGCPTTGCLVTIDPSYTVGEPFTYMQLPNLGHVVDLRNGADNETFVNPVNGSGNSTSESLSQITTNADANSSVAGSGVGSTRLTFSLANTAMAGGSNQLPGNVENPPYGKANYAVSLETGNYFTAGQHVQNQHVVNCYAVGDCLEGSWVLTSSGGYRDMADEGAHPFDLQVNEDWRVFQGTCSSGCTTGSTQLSVNASLAPGTQGEGRFLIDKNPAKTITTGQIVGGGGNVFSEGNFTGTNFPLSVFLQTAAAATSQPKNIAPGTVTLPIVTSGAPTGFATNTSQLPANSGVACIADTNDARFPNFETANYTVVDASHITLTLNKVHGANAVIAVGGLCGYGIEQTADTVGYVRQIFPVIGSVTPTQLYYAAATSGVLGWSAGTGPSTGGFQNISLTVTSIARQNNVVTATLSGSMPVDVNGLTMTVSGVADSSYNGSFKVTTTGSSQLTYTDTGANGTSSGGTIAFLNGSYVLYPMAEVLGVYDASAKQVDGQLTLAANTVAWAPGDAVEEPHYYQQLTGADTEYVTQYVPRPIQYESAGKQYGGEVGPGFRGWQITNGVAGSNYLGDGGTHALPDDAYVVSGPWTNDFEVDAGASAVIRTHCNLHGCNRWDSGYSLFAMDAAVGQDFLTYNPASSTAQWLLGGQWFTFAPSGFTANNVTAATLNSTNVNATTVTATTLKGSLQATGGSSSFVGPNSIYGRALHVSPYAAGYQTGIDFDNPAGVTETQVCGSSSYPGQTNRWQFTMGGDYSWLLYDTTGCRSVLQVLPGGAMALMPGGTGTLSVGGGLTTPPGMFNVGTTNQFFVDGSGNVNAAGTITAKAAIASGVVGNTDLVGTVVLAAGSTSSASYSFTGHYGSAPVCMVQPQSATAATVQSMAAVAVQVSTTSLSVSVASAPAASVTFGYVCVVRN